MANLKTQLTALYKKLGVDINSESAKKILGNPALDAIEVSDDISNTLNKDFFTLESALNHPEILTKARAEALNGIDTHVESLWSEHGLGDEETSQLKAEKKTTAKIKKTIDLIKEKSAEAFKATGKEKQDLVKEVNEAKDALIKLKNDYESKLTEVNNGRKQDKINWQLDSIYSTLDYASPTEKSTSIHLAKALIDKIAKDKGVVFEMGENGLSLKTTSGTDYVQDNNKITPNDFITKTLAEQKFLKVNGNGNGQQNQTITNQFQTDNKNPLNSYLKELQKETVNFIPAT